MIDWVLFCLFSFPNKQKSPDASTAAMSSALGSNLSELDRLLLELNAVQQSSPSFPTTGTHTDLSFNSNVFGEQN